VVQYKKLKHQVFFVFGWVKECISNIRVHHKKENKQHNEIDTDEVEEHFNLLVNSTRYVLLEY
jgi:hypothetical protein